MTKIAIIIPTRDEEDNIARLLNDINTLPCKNDIQTYIVDDSKDDTQKIALWYGAKVIQGRGKGLGQAIVDGIQGTVSDVCLVMDADYSHDPKYIPDMLKPILERGYDMTIGSRYVKGGGTKGWGKIRKCISVTAGLMALPITGIRDNTSGFFAFKREILNGVKISASSWKIMLEILVKCNPTAVMEVPIVFADRTSGKSKFTIKEMRRYLKHLILLGLHKYKPVIKFGVIGLSGAGIHFALLWLFTDVASIWYILSAIMSIVLASTWNYALNHKITFADRHISNHLIGWVKYQVLSGVTDGIYLGLLALFVEVFGVWYLAGAGIAAVLVFPIKYIVASMLIWSKKLNPSDANYEWNAFYNGSVIQKWWKHSIASAVWGWIPETEKLLDYGCGSSPIGAYYGDKAVGYDTNMEKLKFMRAKCPVVRYRNGSLRIMEETFSDIICIEVLEHLHNPESAICDIAYMVKTGGNVVLATPDYSRPLWTIAELFTPYKEEHIVKFTRKSLEVMCKRHSLELVDHKYVAGCDLVALFRKV